MTHLAKLCIGILGLSALACGDALPEREDVRLVSSELVPLGSCEAAEDAARGALIRYMNRRLDENLDRWLKTAGGECDYGDDVIEAAGSPGPTTSPSVPQESSETNNQVAGVDEADFVKHDGEYVYVARNGALRIVDAWPAEEMHVVSTTPLEGEPKKLLLLGNYAVVFSSMQTSPGTSAVYNAPECTHGYDCEFVGLVGLADRSSGRGNHGPYRLLRPGQPDREPARVLAFGSGRVRQFRADSRHVGVRGTTRKEPPHHPRIERVRAPTDLDRSSFRAGRG
jgi:hypothetical protein